MRTSSTTYEVYYEARAKIYQVYSHKHLVGTLLQSACVCRFFVCQLLFCIRRCCQTTRTFTNADHI